jgi:hypothetical protein
VNPPIGKKAKGWPGTFVQVSFRNTGAGDASYTCRAVTEWEVGIPSIEGFVASEEEADRIDRLVADSPVLYGADAEAYFDLARGHASITLTVRAATFGDAVEVACKLVGDEFAKAGVTFPIARDRLPRET